ncbi:hypothetical protein FRC07_011920 [Ceratobasidium sp. 392]|nr:hypothetical protein FRC07_011920 [Ceratobasidium sp. 392]
MAAPRVAPPDVKEPGSSAIVAINIESSDDERDREQTPSPTHKGNNAMRPSLLPQHGPPPPRSGVLPELPEIPLACGGNKRDLPPPSRPPRPDLARELVRTGFRRLVPMTARPLPPGPYFVRIRSTDRKQRPTGAVPIAAHDTSIPQPAPAPAPAIGPAPGPIVVEELRRITYVAWGLPDAIIGPGLLLRNEPVAVVVSRYE